MGKISFKNISIKFISKQKGVTLAELLTAISILGIIAVPFLGSFLSASNNNVSSKDKVYTSILAQKAMDDIKSRPVLLSSQAGTGNKAYSSDAAYRVEYDITEEHIGGTTANADEYNFDLNSINFNQEFAVSRTEVGFNGTIYSLLDGESVKKYYLCFKKDIVFERYSYVLYDDVNPGLQTGELMAGSDICEKIFFKETGSDKFELHVIVDPSMDKNVNLYIVDDFDSRMVLFNDGDIPFYQYYFASSQPQIYSDVLYKIEISVYKGLEKINTLVSYVKK